MLLLCFVQKQASKRTCTNVVDTRTYKNKAHEKNGKTRGEKTRKKQKQNRKKVKNDRTKIEKESKRSGQQEI